MDCTWSSSSKWMKINTMKTRTKKMADMYMYDGTIETVCAYLSCCEHCFFFPSLSAFYIILFIFFICVVFVFSTKSTSESNTKCSETSSPMNVKKKERWWWCSRRRCCCCCCRCRRYHHYHQSVHNNSLIRWYSLFDVCNFVRHSSHPHLFSLVRRVCSSLPLFSQFSSYFVGLYVISLSFCSLFLHILFSAFMRYKTSTV